MADSDPIACGTCWPFTFRGWMLPACAWHDSAYMKDSWQQQHLSREYVDSVFYSQLLELAKRGRCRAGKRVQAWVCYRIVRRIGWAFWEGREYGDPTFEEQQIVANWIQFNTSLTMCSAYV